MNIIITGGCGFIGSALIKFLIKKTNHKILNIDKLTYASNKNYLTTNTKNYSFFKIDICNEKKIKNLFYKFQPNLIIHLAAETHVDNSIKDSKRFMKSNIFGTYNLLEISKEYIEKNKYPKDFKFYYISTDEVYGDLGNKNKLFNENSNYNPSSPYSASKASADHLVRSWGRTYKLPILISNCSNNYGPNQNSEKLIPLVINRAINGLQIPVYGNGKQIRDWLYVDDHVDAIYKIATKGKIGDSYNIGGNNQIKNIDVVKTICDILNYSKIRKPNNINSFFDLITYVSDRKGHDYKYGIDINKINKKLKWKPKENFETGIKKTIKWYLNNIYFKYL